MAGWDHCVNTIPRFRLREVLGYAINDSLHTDLERAFGLS